MKPCRILFAILLGAASLRAQSAQITGRVADQTSAVVPRAEVVISNVDTGVKSQTVSNDQGYFTVSPLEPGNYSVSVVAPGFKPVNKSNIRLSVSQTARVDFSLEVGQVTESVEITAAAPLLESETSSLGQVINNKSILEMPLNGRNSWDLARLSGATVFVGSAGDAGEIPWASMAGGRATTQTLLIDGGSAQKTAIARAMAEMAPMVDAVEEFKVITNNYAAEYGHTAGGVFTAVTKSGTNQYRGTLFEFFRNDAMDARNFFARDKQKLRYNQFGGTLGGPIVRDRTHFFYGVEGTKVSRGQVTLLTVPSLAQRRGDFSALRDAQGRALPIYNPYTTRANPNDATRRLRDPFPGNIIPASVQDPVGVNVASYYGEPNTAGTIAGANNFLTENVARRTQAHNTLRVDHTLTQKDKIFGRYVSQYNHTPPSALFPEPAASGPGSAGPTDIRNHAQTALGSWVRTLSPSLVNEVRYSWLRQRRSVSHPSFGGGWPAKLGLRGVSDAVFPIFAPQGYASLGSGNLRETSGPYHQIIETLTWFHGKHGVKTGFEYRHNGSTDHLDTAASGNFAFSLQGSGLQGTALSGDGFATMLLGFATQGSINDSIPLVFTSEIFGWYLQDDWKVTPNFTLNLGIRYDVETPRISPNNTQNSFDMARIHPTARVPGVIRFAGVAGEPRRPGETDMNNIAPRFGFAWRPFGGEKTVIRGGWGMFYGALSDAPSNSNAALGFATQILRVSPDQNQTPAFVLAQGFPPYAVPGPEIRNDSFGVNGPAEFYERSRRTPYSMQHNFGIQHELRAILLSAQYIGTFGRKLTGQNLTINQVRPELVGGAGTIQARRPFPHFSDVTVLAPNLGSSNYHAFLLHAEKRYQQGLQFLFNYTFSKFIDNVDNTGNSDFGGTPGSGYQDLYNRRLDRSLSPNDITHNATFNAIWDLPWGRGRRWLQSGILSQVAGGWQASVLGTLYSGPPYGVVTQANTCECFSAGPQRADILRNPELSADQRSPARWFDISAFALPARFRFGSAARAVGRSPGIANFDLGIMKNFPVNERIRIQFRGEMFNAFNHTNFGNPGTSLGSPNFGSIVSARDARVVQLGLKVSF